MCVRAGSGSSLVDPENGMPFHLEPKRNTNFAARIVLRFHFFFLEQV
jgi:hypothetical protein